MYDSANLAPSVAIIPALFLSRSLYTVVVEISSEISNSIDISSASEADVVGQRGQTQASEKPTQRNQRNHTNSTIYPTCVVAPSNKTKHSAGHKLVPPEFATLSKKYGGQAMLSQTTAAPQSTAAAAAGDGASMLLGVCSVFFSLDPTDVGSVRCALVCALLVLERRAVQNSKIWVRIVGSGSVPLLLLIVRKTVRVYSRGAWYKACKNSGRLLRGQNFVVRTLIW